MLKRTPLLDQIISMAWGNLSKKKKKKKKKKERKKKKKKESRNVENEPPCVNLNPPLPEILDPPLTFSEQISGLKVF